MLVVICNKCRHSNLEPRSVASFFKSCVRNFPTLDEERISQKLTVRLLDKHRSEITRPATATGHCDRTVLRNSAGFPPKVRQPLWIVKYKVTDFYQDSWLLGVQIFMKFWRGCLMVAFLSCHCPQRIHQLKSHNIAT